MGVGVVVGWWVGLNHPTQNLLCQSVDDVKDGSHLQVGSEQMPLNGAIKSSN